jgi:arylsulfatase A-like enzyme
MLPDLPNVLLVVFDTARADAFEPYGAGLGATPTVADLARAGGAVPFAVAPSNWTMPSHASMFTGLLPRDAGLVTAPGGRAGACRPVVERLAPRLLPAVLRRAGYRTAGISSNAWVGRETGFATGFDRFVHARTGRHQAIHRPGVRARLAWAAAGLAARADDGARAAEAELRRWIEEGPARPFFWFVNLVECHSPYLPPRPYNDLGPLARLRAADEARRHLTMGAIWRTCLRREALPPAVTGRMRHLYGRAVRSMDDWLGRVLGALEDARLLADTLVVVTSDHGENLGEGALLGHAFSLDQRLLRVPLVAAGPARLAAPAVTSLAALPRLLADALGLEDHPWRADEIPTGAAVAQYRLHLPDDDRRVREAVERWRLDEAAVDRLIRPGTAATDGRFKVVRHGEREEVFDLAADPLETRPLGPEEAARAAGREALERLRALLDWRAPAGMPAGAEPPAAGPEDRETAELEERLRALGYL